MNTHARRTGIKAALGLILLAVGFAGCASTAATRNWLMTGESVLHTNAGRMDHSPRPGLGLVANHGKASWLTVLVFPGRFSLQGRQDSLFVPDPETGKLQLVREPMHRFVLGPASVYGVTTVSSTADLRRTRKRKSAHRSGSGPVSVYKRPTEYWLWLPPERDYTFLVITWQGLLWPRVANMRVEYAHPDGRVFDRRYTRQLDRTSYYVDWKVEVSGLDHLPSLQEALGIPRHITIDLQPLLQELNPLR